MKKIYNLCFAAVATLCASAACGQGISSFSGSGGGEAGGNVFSFYNPLITGTQAFSNAIVSTGPVQITNDTAVIVDSSFNTYDLDSIPDQLVFSGVACSFYLKSDSLQAAGKFIRSFSYTVAAGNPSGSVKTNRLHLFQYMSRKDTIEFQLKFTLVTSTGETVESKTNVNFKVVPSLVPESASFGIAGQQRMPDATNSEFNVFSQNIDVANTTFNFQSVKKKRVSFSGAKVLLQAGNSSNPVNPLIYNTDSSSFNIDTLSIYTDTLTIRGPVHFAATTVYIYAKNLVMEDLPGKPAYLCTTPLSGIAVPNPRIGQRGGDIHLHIANFTANPGRRFITNGGDGENSTTFSTNLGGAGGNLYATLPLSKYLITEGGYRSNRKYYPSLNQAAHGTFISDPKSASWLHPSFLHIVKNYNNEAFYSGVTDVVANTFIYYTSIINSFIANGSINDLEEDDRLQVQQIGDEMSQVVYNIYNGLDYYGNPPGWVPMLSLEVARAAYQSEIDHAMNVIFLDHLVQTANDNLQKRQAAFTALRNEATLLVNKYTTQYKDLAFTVIPAIKNNIDGNQSRINVLTNEILAIDRELQERAQDKYNTRQTWKWVGVAVKALAALPIPDPKVKGAITAATTGVTYGVKFFGSDDQKNGFDNTAQAAAILAGLQPFMSGDQVTSANQMGNIMDVGIADLNMQNLNATNPDAVNAAAEAARLLYNQNKALLANVDAGVTRAVDIFNRVMAVGESELGAIKGELLANEPRVGLIREEMQLIASDQQKLGQKLQTSTMEMLQAKNNIFAGITAMSHFNDEVIQASVAFDHKLSVFTNDMRKRAYDRLRKYYYFMVKAYEYREIETLGSSMDMTSILNRIEQLINDDPTKTALSAADYDALRAIFEEQIHVIADLIYNKYQENQPSSSGISNLSLTVDEVRDLNQGKTITINLVDKGLFPTNREDLRINGLEISNIALTPVTNPDFGSFSALNFKFEYPNISKIKKDGNVYMFNNYNPHTVHPISWITDYDVPTNILTPTHISYAAQSLLSNLFEGTSGASLLQIFATPAAWADIRLTMGRTTNGATNPNMESLTIKVAYDFLPKNSGNVYTELRTNYKWFAPTFEISKKDQSHRQSGIGNTYRSYSTNAATIVTATAPAKYGRYNFTNWATLAGTPLTNGNGIDITGGNKLRYSLLQDRSFRAMYVYDGPVLSVLHQNNVVLNLPDTIYLNDTLQYSLQIRNTGTGKLNWDLDSMSSWIKYSLNTTGENDSTIILNFEMNQDVNKRRVGVIDVSSLETEAIHHYVYFVQSVGHISIPTTYTFTGNGNWDNAANWLNNKIPPVVLPGGSQIVINPAGTGECVLNRVQWLSTGATMDLPPGKKITVTGKVEWQR